MTVTPSPKVLAVIPARYASTRFPGKMIAPIQGKPLVLHTFERACEATLVTEAVIAIDDERIAEALRPFPHARFVMTRPDHPSGTDRIAEVVLGSDADIIVNVQGDEPLIDPRTIDSTIRPLLEYSDVPMATAMVRIRDEAKVADPNVVKVVCDGRGRALYFSRCPIPYVRDASDRCAAGHYEHVGLYVFRRDFLLRYAKWPVTPLERVEKLEQLRVLEHGYPVAVVETEFSSVGVDSPADLERVLARLAAGAR